MTISDSEIFKNSTIDGEVDQTDVYLFTQGSTKLYYFRDQNKITSYVLVSGNDLKGIRNRTGTKGAITALMTYIVRHKKNKLEITNTEMLTKDGLKWVLSMISMWGRGFSFSDQDGNDIDPEQLKKEWQFSKISGQPGDLSIIIENNQKYYHRKKSIMPKHEIIGNSLLF